MNSPPTTTLVFIPSPGTGHVVPTVEFAKLLLRRDHRLSVKIFLMSFPFTPSDHVFATSLVDPSDPRIELIHLLPPPDRPSPPLQHVPVFIESLVPRVRDVLGTLTTSTPNAPPAALILSFFCLPMVDLADELGLASYLFLASGLGFLSLMLNHRAISDQIATGGETLSLPGVRDPIPLRVVLPTLFPSNEHHAASLELAAWFRRPRGIIVNSFEDLELSREVRYLLSADGEPPPVYTVGPVLDLTGLPVRRLIDPAQRYRVMKWLDDQPQRSVLLLCFGSMGSFGAKQLREIAAGVERSRCRFLWFIRPPQGNDGEAFTAAALPEGFSERTRRRGMVVCGAWAPQAEVLAHVATGGFVTHCGWNSVLESLWWGVPTATLPIGAEQPLNAFRMAREWGVAVEMRSDYYRDEAAVAAEEIEAAVRRLMEESERGEVMRRKVREMSEMARKAVAEGGSSFNAVGQLISDIMAIPKPCTSA